MAEDPRPPSEPSPLGDGVSLAWYFPVGIGVGLLLGGWVGNLFGRRTLGMTIGAVWGFAGGCWEIWKVYRRVSNGR